LTVTLTLVFRDSVLGAVPVVPVTVTVKLATPVQVTDKTFVTLNETVQPAGGVTGAVTARETVPAKPLTAFTDIVEVPAVPTVVLIEAGTADRAKS